MSEPVVMDPEVVKAAQEIFEQMTRHSAPKLGMEWSIIIERRGKALAEVRRSTDVGIRMVFYSDATI